MVTENGSHGAQHRKIESKMSLADYYRVLGLLYGYVESTVKMRLMDILKLQIGQNHVPVHLRDLTNVKRNIICGSRNPAVGTRLRICSERIEEPLPNHFSKPINLQNRMTKGAFCNVFGKS